MSLRSRIEQKWRNGSLEGQGSILSWQRCGGRWWRNGVGEGRGGGGALCLLYAGALNDNWEGSSSKSYFWQQASPTRYRPTPPPSFPPFSLHSPRPWISATEPLTSGSAYSCVIVVVDVGRLSLPKRADGRNAGPRYYQIVGCSCSLIVALPRPDLGLLDERHLILHAS